MSLPGHVLRGNGTSEWMACSNCGRPVTDLAAERCPHCSWDFNTRAVPRFDEISYGLLAPSRPIPYLFGSHETVERAAQASRAMGSEVAVVGPFAAQDVRFLQELIARPQPDPEPSDVCAACDVRVAVVECHECSLAFCSACVVDTEGCPSCSSVWTHEGAVAS